MKGCLPNKHCNILTSVWKALTSLKTSQCDSPSGLSWWTPWAPTWSSSTSMRYTPKFTMKYKCRYIMTYKYKVHPNVAKLLKHYSKSGKIGLRPITLPGQWQFVFFCIFCILYSNFYIFLTRSSTQPTRTSTPLYREVETEQKTFQNNSKKKHRFDLANFKRWKQKKRLNELIPYNDCFYRNMYRCNFRKSNAATLLYNVQVVHTCIFTWFSSWPAAIRLSGWITSITLDA